MKKITDPKGKKAADKGASDRAANPKQSAATAFAANLKQGLGRLRQQFDHGASRVVKFEDRARGNKI